MASRYNIDPRTIAANQKQRYARYRRANRDKANSATRKCNWRRAGISFSDADYNLLFVLQKGLCAICRKPDPKRRLAVDHDHTTQEIRGLLCHKCNRALGFFEDSLLIAESIVRYLKGVDHAYLSEM